jgi:hypothetical protein
MNLARLILLSVVSSSLVSTAFARVERTVEKTFTVRPGGTLSVSTFGGNITVEPGSGNEVKVVARQVFPRAGNDADADKIVADLELVMEQKGDSVNASARYTKERSGMNWGSWPPMSVAFTVTVPSTYSVDLKTSGGNIEVGDLTGSAKVRTSGGNLRFGRFKGPVDGGTSGGDISLTEAVNEVHLKTSGGNIRVDRASGDVRLNTSGGNITIGSVSGSLDASTSGGNIRVTVDGQIAKDISLSTSGGTVEAKVSRDAAFRLDASTSGGGVRTKGLKVTIEKGGDGKDRLVGAVNGGGPTVKLRSSGGSIMVSES